MSASLIVFGLLLFAFNQVISGAIILLIFRGAIASLGPTIIAKQFGDTETVLDNLARLQSWRDIGAAAGPMVTGFALVYISAEIQHLVLAIIFGVVLVLSSPKITTNSN